MSRFFDSASASKGLAFAGLGLTPLVVGLVVFLFASHYRPNVGPAFVRPRAILAVPEPLRFAALPQPAGLEALRPETPATPEPAPVEPRPLAYRPVATPQPPTEPAPLPPVRPADIYASLDAPLPPRRTDALEAAPPPGALRPGDVFARMRPHDQFTAVYDVSAHTVYLPNGAALEAHSGLGALRDDPSHVDTKDRGATPPHLYELTLREDLFHGVQALRLNPVGGPTEIYGREGLLAHTYMLGPGGDSNGCVSFKDYDAFLRAFQAGLIRRLEVVARSN